MNRSDRLTHPDAKYPEEEHPAEVGGIAPAPCRICGRSAPRTWSTFYVSCFYRALCATAGTVWAPTSEEAIKLWNERQAQPADAKMVKELRHALKHYSATDDDRARWQALVANAGGA